MTHLQALILAAGSSRRFPVHKLLHPLPDGRCLLDITYQQAIQLTPQILFVINTDVQLRQHCEAHHYGYVINSQAESGMASSIACGVTAAADASGWAIFLADMPCIKASTLRLLAKTYSKHDVLVPIYQQQHGHPVIFSAHWFTKLRGLTGDQGARGLLRDNPAVHLLETGDAGVCLDIDTQADWNSFLERGCP